MKKLKVNLRKKIALTDWVKVVLLCDALHPRKTVKLKQSKQHKIVHSVFGAGGGGRYADCRQLHAHVSENSPPGCFLPNCLRNSPSFSTPRKTVK